MNIDILQNGRSLRQIHYDGQIFLEVPGEGEYAIRLTNHSPNRRLTVVSVDGLNVVDGSDASPDGSGYVLEPWRSVTIQGFLRSGSECARFTFAGAGGSYAAQTGRGTKNTGVIGVAVFDGQPKPVAFVPPVIIEHHHQHHPSWPWFTTTSNSRPRGVRGLGIGRTLCSTGPTEASFEPGLTYGATTKSAAPDLGTSYGRSEKFYTSKVDFVRTTAAPAFVLTLRYGVTAKLREWGVPVEAPVFASPAAPNPFPAAPGYAQPPAGWRG